MRKVAKRADGCWEWIGKRFRNQYGVTTITHHKKARHELAHRTSYRLFVGEIPAEKLVLHRCDRPWCVNPEHLFVGTYADNAQDMINKGRQNWAYGERGGLAKLTDAQVIEIREAHARGELQREIAARFGVSAKQISVIVNRKQRKNV